MKIIPIMVILAASALAQSTWTQENLKLEQPNASLNGTLTIPSGAQKVPVVMIIAGSGPTDQNGNSLGSQIQPNSYKLLSEALAAKGIASLRYDKRGIGTSRTTQTEDQLRFEDFANDASAYLEQLRTDSRFSGVYVLGHSEGSLLGMLAAKKTRVDGYISLAGVGRFANEILLEQLTPQVSTAMLEEIKRVLQSLKSGQVVPAKNIVLPVQLVNPLFRDSVQPYLISWFRYDPSEEIKKLETRVLILQGSTDIQVGVLDANLLGAAIGQPAIILEGMNHVLKTATLEPTSQNAAYTSPTQAITPSLIVALEQFIRP